MVPRGTQGWGVRQRGCFRGARLFGGGDTGCWWRSLCLNGREAEGQTVHAAGRRGLWQGNTAILLTLHAHTLTSVRCCRSASLTITAAAGGRCPCRLPCMWRTSGEGAGPPTTPAPAPQPPALHRHAVGASPSIHFNKPHVRPCCRPPLPLCRWCPFLPV